MTRTRRLTATVLTSLTLALTYLVPATTAHAMPAPADGGGGYVDQTPPPTTTVVTHPGSPLWTYAVVALAAAVLTLAVAWLVSRRRHPNHHTVPAEAA
jgi:ABC-type branched-subunit amino acid transport system permease subunit